MICSAWKGAQGRRALLGWAEGSAENWRGVRDPPTAAAPVMWWAWRAAEGGMLLPGSSGEPCGKEWLVLG